MSRTGMFRFEVDETDDRGELQQLKGRGYGGEELTQVHRAMPFGLHTHAPKGSHGIGLALGEQRNLVVALGMEHKDHRPKNTEAGETRLYDANGNVISIVKKDCRIVHGTAIVLVAPKIVLQGEVHLGGEGGKLVHRKVDDDSNGDTAVGSASKVFAL